MDLAAKAGSVLPQSLGVFRSWNLILVKLVL